MVRLKSDHVSVTQINEEVLIVLENGDARVTGGQVTNGIGCT